MDHSVFVCKPHFPDSYINHPVFVEIKSISKFYEGLSDSCTMFIPSGAPGIGNYASYIYSSLQGTLESIQTLLKIGRINDAYTLVRTMFDVVLTEIYIDVVRKEKFDWKDCVVVKDVDDWLNGKHRIPPLKKLLGILKKAPSTKGLYPLFGWDTYLKHNREYLDDSVHANRYKRLLANCNDIYLPSREKHLKNIQVILNQIAMLHISFIFHMNAHYMAASDYLDYLDMGATPPEGSEKWLCNYAQEAFDRYIKPYPKLANFIKEECGMDLK